MCFLPICVQLFQNCCMKLLIPTSRYLNVQQKRVAILLNKNKLAKDNVNLSFANLLFIFGILPLLILHFHHPFYHLLLTRLRL